MLKDTFLKEILLNGEAINTLTHMAKVRKLGARVICVPMILTSSQLKDVLDWSTYY